VNIPLSLLFGQLLFVTLMGIGGHLPGRLLREHRWMAYVGLAISLYVAREMINRGIHELRLPVIGAIGFVFS
jgi:predicted tellurium resistance membrane protein TerC